LKEEAKNLKEEAKYKLQEDESTRKKKESN
jgi:hypothetical protein